MCTINGLSIINIHLSIALSSINRELIRAKFTNETDIKYDKLITCRLCESYHNTNQPCIIIESRKCSKPGELTGALVVGKEDPCFIL